MARREGDDRLIRLVAGIAAAAPDRQSSIDLFGPFGPATANPAASVAMPVAMRRVHRTEILPAARVSGPDRIRESILDRFHASPALPSGQHLP